MEVINSVLVSLANLASAKLFGAVVTALIVLFVGKFLLGLVNKTVEKAHMDVTLQKFLNAAAKVVIYFVAIMIVASALGFEMSSLVALASVVSAAFALAASGVLSNLFGGLLLLITKPFGVDDYVAVGGEEGIVLEIGLLTTKINTVDNKRITIPNSNIASATIVNYTTEGKRRVDLVFNVGYDNDMERVKTAMVATANNHALVVDCDSTFARVSGYNECTVSYTLRAWCKSEHYWDVYFDLMEQVKSTFDQVGIKMVYPTLNVRMPQDEK